MGFKVRTAVRKKWHRYRTTRFRTSRNRRRASRTSSFFLSTSEVPLIIGLRKKITRRSQEKNLPRSESCVEMAALKKYLHNNETGRDRSTSFVDVSDAKLNSRRDTTRSILA